MARLMVEIEIPNYDYKDLVEEVITHKKKGYAADCWYSEEDGKKVLVDETYLQRSLTDESFYAFTLIGVKP